MNVVICQDKEAPIKVSLKSGDIYFSLAKAIELRDRLTSIIGKVKKTGKKRHMMTKVKCVMREKEDIMGTKVGFIRQHFRRWWHDYGAEFIGSIVFGMLFAVLFFAVLHIVRG